MSEQSRRTFLKTTAVSAAAIALSSVTRSVDGALVAGKNEVVTNDGYRLHYLEAGSGKPLVLIPGWSQTAAEFKHQVAGLSDHYRVIAVDMRGHGESDKPDHGYTIARLAKDVHDLLVDFNLQDVTILGHSMGCSVIWSYWELFGPERLAKLVLVDQMPMITSNPAWSAEEKEASGAILDPTTLYGTINSLAGPDGVKTTEGFIGSMVTPAMARPELDWMIRENLKMPREYAARLLYNHATQDWRRVIPRLNIPTLVVGGKASLVPWKSQVWIHNQIRGSQLEIFEANEGGAHFMFIENPEKFNRIVREFIG